MQRLSVLLELIENTRILMYESIKNNGTNSNETIKLSQRLDLLIIKYQLSNSKNKVL
jgi:hypothetical protein